MSTQPVYINASAVQCSQIDGKLTQAALTNAQLLNSTLNSENTTEGKFLYKPINNKGFGENGIINNGERIFRTLFNLVDELISKHNLTTKDLANTSLFLGSSSMDIGIIKSDPKLPIWLTPIDKITTALSKRYGLNKLNFTFITACTSSANAIIYATRLLKSKQIHKAIILGCEFYNQLTVSGFLSLGLLSNQSLLAFSNHRSGMVLGEGVGALLLSNQSFAHDDIEILSGHSSCDSYSLTSSKEDGSHIAGIIQSSISMSGIKPEDIDLVKVHGTASPNSDDTEFNALKRIFKDIPPIMALKPFTGHTLGACAAIETAIVHTSIKNNNLPLPDYTKQPENCLLSFSDTGLSINKYGYMLHNYCGFGGNNAAIILKNRNCFSI